MTCALYFDLLPAFAGTVAYPDGRGVISLGFGAILERQALPTDPIGTFTLTLTHLIDGSALQIESQDGTTTLHNSVVSGTSKTVILSVYSAGSPLNSLRIKVRKGSASPFYQPYETEATALVGSQSIYVSQIPDE